MYERKMTKGRKNFRVQSFKRKTTFTFMIVTGSIWNTALQNQSKFLL